MINNELYQYMTMLIVMTVITIGLVLYAIIKSDFTKRTFRVLMSIFILDALILGYFLIKLWIF